MRVSGLVALLAAVACDVAVAWADGCFFTTLADHGRAAGFTEAASTEQKGIVIELPGGREALLLQTTYHGPAQDFVWIVPVPGKPGPGDVFLAEPAFIKELVANTAPEVRTTLTEAGGPGAMQQGMGGARMAADEDAREAVGVTVHERLEVGKLDAVVLSATGPEVLAGWLQNNEYRVPDGAAAIFRDYVERRWYFVALKVQPSRAAEQPVLSDVDPIGIRFPSRGLVYPLRISRVSSPEKTALLLLVLSRGPVRCDQFPPAKLPLDEQHPRGSFYASLRRGLVDSDKPTLVTEYCGPEGMPYPDLYYAKDAWVPDEGKDWSASSLWTSRYWTLLELDEMVDLTFSPAGDQASTRLVVSRTGVIDPEVFRQLRKQELLTRATQGASRRPWLIGAVSVLALAALLAWATRARRRRLRTSILGALVGLGATALWAGLPPAGRSPATAGPSVGSESALKLLDTALSTLDEKIEWFRERHGCYPARLEDLAPGARPTQGVDSSGNVVEIAPAPGGASQEQPYGGDLPIDPLTGRRDTWIYEPNGSPMVESGAFEVRLSVVEATEPHEGEKYGFGRVGWSLHDMTRRRAERYWLPEPWPSLPFRRDPELPPEVPTVPAGLHTVAGQMRTSGGCRVILASVSCGVAEVGDANSEVGALAFAADSAQYVYAGRGSKVPWVLRCRIGSHEGPRPIIRRTWPVEVLDLAWHPLSEKWAVAAREAEAPEGQAGLYVIDSAGVPQAVGGPACYLSVAYAPTGRSLLAIVGDPGQPEVGALERVRLPDGAREVLAKQVALRPFFASADGCVTVCTQSGEAQALHLVDAQGNSREVPLPTHPCRVLDVWAGDRDILAALERPDNPLGEVWSYSLSEDEWRIVATWDMDAAPQSKAAGDHAQTDQITLLGRCPQLGHCLIALPHGGCQVYVVYDRYPSARLAVLGQPPALVGAGPWVRLRLNGQEVNGLTEGILWPNAFEPGDLAVRPPFDKEPFEVQRVTKLSRQSVTVGGKRVPLCDKEPIRIERDAYRRFLLKVKPL